MTLYIIILMLHYTDSCYVTGELYYVPATIQDRGGRVRLLRHAGRERAQELAHPRDQLLRLLLRAARRDRGPVREDRPADPTVLTLRGRQSARRDPPVPVPQVHHKDAQ